jgi:hypothetical protein
VLVVLVVVAIEVLVSSSSSSSSRRLYMSGQLSSELAEDDESESVSSYVVNKRQPLRQ